MSEKFFGDPIDVSIEHQLSDYQIKSSWNPVIGFGIACILFIAFTWSEMVDYPWRFVSIALIGMPIIASTIRDHKKQMHYKGKQIFREFACSGGVVTQTDTLCGEEREQIEMLVAEITEKTKLEVENGILYLSRPGLFKHPLNIQFDAFINDQAMQGFIALARERGAKIDKSAAEFAVAGGES